MKLIINMRGKLEEQKLYFGCIWLKDIVITKIQYNYQQDSCVIITDSNKL